MIQPFAFGLLIACLGVGAASAQSPSPLTEEALADQRGGLATPLGFDVGFGASVKTYVDGSLALETRMVWTATGAQTERTFQSDQAKALTGAASTGPLGRVEIAPGASVIHDLTDNRIASVLINSGSDRVIRQDTDITLSLPQLPDLQQQIGAERLSQGLQSLSPQATGLSH